MIVEVKIKCPDCKGKKWIPSKHYMEGLGYPCYRCSTCNGNGEIFQKYDIENIKEIK